MMSLISSLLLHDQRDDQGSSNNKHNHENRDDLSPGLLLIRGRLLQVLNSLSNLSVAFCDVELDGINILGLLVYKTRQVLKDLVHLDYRRVDLRNVLFPLFNQRLV